VCEQASWRRTRDLRSRRGLATKAFKGVTSAAAEAVFFWLPTNSFAEGLSLPTRIEFGSRSGAISARAAKAFGFKSGNAFRLLSDDRSPRSDGPAGSLRALSFGYVSLNRTRRLQFYCARAPGFAAIMPLWRRGRIRAIPILVANLPGDSPHSPRATSRLGATAF
jgi:hypothetical protein